jgi:hypothetical protein
LCRAVTCSQAGTDHGRLLKEQPHGHAGRYRRRVIGVDTHRDTLAAAAVTPIGRLTAQTQARADAQGYPALLNFAHVQVPGRRCWAIEGAGSYGAGLACFLLEHDEWVVEICRPKRSASRTGAKTDADDAVRAANQALALERLAAPRQRGHREALRVLLATRRGAVAARVDATNQFKALIVGHQRSCAPGLRGLPTAKQIRSCATLRNRPAR